MDRLLQGVDEDTGQPFVLFGKVKIQTLSDGHVQVVDERDGTAREFVERDEALRSVGLDPKAVEAADVLTPEQPIIQVRSLISYVENKALMQKADELGLTREAAIRRAIAAFVLED